MALGQGQAADEVDGCQCMGVSARGGWVSVHHELGGCQSTTKWMGVSARGGWVSVQHEVDGCQCTTSWVGVRAPRGG